MTDIQFQADCPPWNSVGLPGHESLWEKVSDYTNNSKFTDAIWLGEYRQLVIHDPTFQTLSGVHQIMIVEGIVAKLIPCCFLDQRNLDPSWRDHTMSVVRRAVDLLSWVEGATLENTLRLCADQPISSGGTQLEQLAHLVMLNIVPKTINKKALPETLALLNKYFVPCFGMVGVRCLKRIVTTSSEPRKLRNLLLATLNTYTN